MLKEDDPKTDTAKAFAAEKARGLLDALRSEPAGRGRARAR
ncbi:MAG: hypothetical protein U0791_01580 [Gemmataceae bacterium]